MNIKAIELAEFLSLDFVERVYYIYRIYGKRFWSWQLAEIWNRLLKEVDDPGEQQLMLRQLIQLAPYSEDSERAFETLFNNDLFNGTDRGVARVHLIVSCEKYLAKSECLFHRLSERLDELYLVVGRPGLKTAKFDGKYLFVPAKDNYESLPVKVIESLVAVTQKFGAVDVIKIDDDVSMTSGHSLSELEELLEDIDYAGLPAGGKRFDRCWHFGKCENLQLALNSTHYGGFWARGQLYYLSKKAIRVLLHEFLFYPGELAGELYEDKMIGDILRNHGILLSEINLERVLGVVTTDEAPPVLSELDLVP